MATDKPTGTPGTPRTGAAAGGGRGRQRLDVPRASRRGLVPAYDPEIFGRFSESIARFLGTGRFLAWMTVVLATWVVWNTTAPSGLRFDNYPFIFMNLALSLQAAYAAPLILLAQNRQDDRDRVNLDQDRRRNERSIADTEYLTREIAALRMGLGEVATRDWIRSELQDMLKELEERQYAQLRDELIRVSDGRTDGREGRADGRADGAVLYGPVDGEARGRLGPRELPDGGPRP